MIGSMKTSLIIIMIIALALLAGLIVTRLRPAEPDAASVSGTSRGRSFEVHVVMPRLARPLFGILPDPLVARLDGTLSEVGFDHASPGAAIGRVGHNRLELRADGGWDLSIATDGEGLVAPRTRLVFPLRLGERDVILRCRPAGRATSYLRTIRRAGADELGGHFLVKLATCENAVSGKATEWPPAALTLRGSFEGLPQGGKGPSG